MLLSPVNFCATLEQHVLLSLGGQSEWLAKSVTRPRRRRDAVLLAWILVPFTCPFLLLLPPVSPGLSR